ncbi:hypothetical protein VTN77DRAFT_1098 [Rasamsonia byssochlamydoides]|uniref:uncharacterized protein n=1 Tax=Rasamsonia byssochlamydoides TaxID=89139 RepID=UPI0037430917
MPSEQHPLLQNLVKTILLQGLVITSATATATSLSFTIPSSVPSNSSGILDPAPVGVSFEFFAFPEYFQDLPATQVCLSNLKDAMGGASPPIRIGGTTQDRATYNSSLSTPVSYSVASPSDAPMSLTFGPSYMDLAGSYDGSVTIGLNRRLNNISNTIEAAKVAVSKIPNLYAIELGNEPNFFTSSDPIANGSAWTPAADAASQVFWQQSVGTGLNRTSIIQAGVFFGSGDWSIAELAPQEGSSEVHVKSFCDHYYPQSASTANLPQLMNHSAIIEGVAGFADDVSVAIDRKIPFVFGETNSATGGGGGISPTYGAALWILDYVMQAVLLGVKQLFFHQGTIGNCQYCWWGRYDMGAPYYGAYMAALTLSGASQLAQLDTGDTPYAVYAVYNQDGAPIRALLYNSEYYTNTTGTRDAVSITLAGIPSTTTVSARRLTGNAATARVDQGGNITIAGLTFANGSCVIQGGEVVEKYTADGGVATFNVAASEALLVEFE